MDVQSEWGTKIRSLKDSVPFKLFLGTFLIYIFCNNGVGWGSASERTRYAQIKAIVEDNVLYVDRFIPTFPDSTVWDLSLSPNGHYYPNKPPGLTFLGVPILFITTKLNIQFPWDGWILILLSCSFTSFAVIMVYLMCKNILAMNEKVSIITSLIFAFATFAFPHAVTLYSNVYSQFFVIFTTYFLIDRQNTENTILRLFLSGTGMGFLILLDYPNLLLIAPMLLYLLSSKNWRLIWLFLLPVGLFATILAWYQFVCFESPFVTTYTYAVTHGDVTTGFNNPLHIGLIALLITPRRGLFLYSPILLFGFYGLAKMLQNKTERKEALLFISFFLILLIFFALQKYSSGWVFGSRRLTPVLPLFVLFVGKVLTLPKDSLFSFVPWNNARSFLETHGNIIFWTLFGILLSISIGVNTIGAITDVHPTNTTYFDYNVELLLSGQISSFAWNISPILGLAIVIPAIILNIYAIRKVSQNIDEYPTI
ncbi:MAG: ArnT family glycosyltransferase [Promethearchaeota archaeon]